MFGGERGSKDEDGDVDPSQDPRISPIGEDTTPPSEGAWERIREAIKKHKEENS